MSDDDDDLSGLKAAMDAATPRPDPATRAAHLRLAQENYAALQGSRDGARQNSERPQKGLIGGLKTMFAQLTTRGALTATTAIAALGIVMILPPVQPVWRSLAPKPVVSEPEAVIVDEEVALGLARQETQRADPLVAPAAEVMADAAPVAEDDAAAEPMILPAAPLAAKRSVEGRVTLQAAPAAGLVQADDAMMVQPEANTEAFANADPNPVRIVTEEPVSTFSIDVDTASYSVVRSSLTRGSLPPAQAVRIEEMVNYFPYAYPAPEAGQPFRPTVSVVQTPWNPDTRMVHIAIQGALPQLDDRPPLNLVFLIDTSGSMQDPDKLPLLKQSFAMMLGQLRPEDQVAIVTYAGSAGQVLAPTEARDRAAILGALDRLSAGGSTAGAEGLRQAYQVARAMSAEGEVTRVLLATDGDFNVGISDPSELKDYIARERDSGVYLSVLGFGRGNLDDATMQALAQNGNGTAAYIDTLQEAQKVLVDQLSGALFPIANDVKIQVEFNPAQIAEYRLIGYETRALRREDFNNDRVDAGEIGAGHRVTALYEVTPVDSPARLSDPLRYQPQAVAGTEGELGFLRLRYKEPGASVSQLIETPITDVAGEAGAEMRWAMAIAGFGQLLTGGTYLGDWGWDQAIALANGARGEDRFGYRSEAVQLMRLAQSLSR